MLTEEQIEREISECEAYEKMYIYQLIHKLEGLLKKDDAVYYDLSMEYCRIFMSEYSDVAARLEDLQIMQEEMA